MPTPSAACTAACTSEAENANADTLDADHCSIAERIDADQGDKGEGIDQGAAARGSSTAGAPSGSADPLAKLAAALLTLSPADRERLAAMLTGGQGAT